MPDDCIFCKIVAGEIPAQRFYEDEVYLAFPDIHPAAPVHLIVIPKEHIAAVNETDNEAALGGLLMAANAAASKSNVDSSGFRVVINCGPDGGQEVPHLHLHLLGGRYMGWPPG